MFKLYLTKIFEQKADTTGKNSQQVGMEWLLGIFLTISFHPYPGDILKPNEL
jgi:hypothetical protein